MCVRVSRVSFCFHLFVRSFVELDKREKEKENKWINLNCKMKIIVTRVNPTLHPSQDVTP